LCGYENERITGIKSDSQFPRHAIEELSRYFDLKTIDNVYISHWATFGDVSEMSYKHWDEGFIKRVCPNATIKSHKKGITHHDAHKKILDVFTNPKSFVHSIVADGFGNFNETISIYKGCKLIYRCFGFEKSLGLLYQYTTAYLDLKMNQDEYKLLGYESHIKEVASDEHIRIIQKYSDVITKKYVNSILRNEMVPGTDLVAGLEALPNIRLLVKNRNDAMMSKLPKEYKNDIYKKRVVISFFLQSIVEKVMLTIIRHFNINSVSLTGGLFMNVKLNNAIAKVVDEVSIMPVCGDQACGLGVYEYYNQDLIWPGHLFWGRRLLQSTIKSSNTVVTVLESSAITTILLSLQQNKIVNIVKGSMEFGARALGNTSTLMLPTKENVDYNNMLNDRSSIMPCAGMICDFMLKNYVDHYKIYKSLEYMIVTLDYKCTPNTDIIGVMHKTPLSEVWTNRVQVLGRNHFLYDVVMVIGTLINTSFNVHGTTIPLTEEQIMYNIDKQSKRDVDDRVINVILW
jgi:carbamoyltransferase